MFNRVSELRIHHAAACQEPSKRSGPGTTSGTADRSPSAKEATRRVVVIDGQTLIRESLVQALRAASGEETEGFETVEAWLSARGDATATTILLCASDGEAGDAQLKHVAAKLLDPYVPFVVVAASEHPDAIVGALEAGARGYIPTSLPLSVMVQALHFVGEGGVFVPASSLIASRRHPQPDPAKTEVAALLQQFTSRQVSVIRSLCRGRSNKVIAYDLNMCESTVKVHVRNIMRKIKARNRTEVAVMFKSLVEDAQPAPLSKAGTSDIQTEHRPAVRALR